MQKGLVIPCYNETQRLPTAEIFALLDASPDLTLLLVDDASTDGTKELVGALALKHERVKNLILPQNQGKAEAVRAGMREFIRTGCEWIGYADADFATPARELLRLMQVAESHKAMVVMGSRVRLLGA